MAFLRKPGLAGYVDDPTIAWTPETRRSVIDKVTDLVRDETGVQEILAKPRAQLDEPMRIQVRARIAHHLGNTLDGQSLRRVVSRGEEDQLVRLIAQTLLGLGFLENYLPPVRTDLSEIGVNPDGTFWVMPQGTTRFELIPEHFSPAQIMTIVDRILGPLNLRCNQTDPIVSARLPRDPERGLPGGARVHVVHPRCAIGAGYPDLRIRLFETQVVRPDRLLHWRALDEAMLQFLQSAIHDYRNIVVIGSTGTGKTTFLNMLSNYIPAGDRVVSIETAQELWLAVENWTPLEEQPANVDGAHGVDSGVLLDAALRLTTQWIVVGEIRSGAAAAKAVLAQSTGHAGLTTLHAESARIAINVLMQRLSTTDEFKGSERAVRAAIPSAVHLIVHLVNKRIRDPRTDEVRQRRLVQEIAQVDEHTGGDVTTTTLWRYTGDYLDQDRWEQEGEFTRWVS